MIRHVIEGHTQPIPAVLEIPSKDHPYDASKDSILRRAKVSTISRPMFCNFIFYIGCIIIVLFDFRECLIQRMYDKFIYQIILSFVFIVR
jgi:hypothetical protein